MQATIACFQFSLPEGVKLLDRFGEDASLFSIHPVLPHRWDAVVVDAMRTGLLITLDDGKGASSLSHKLISQVLLAEPKVRTISVTREECAGFGVSPDKFEVSIEEELCRL